MVIVVSIYRSRGGNYPLMWDLVTINFVSYCDAKSYREGLEGKIFLFYLVGISFPTALIGWEMSINLEFGIWDCGFGIFFATEGLGWSGRNQKNLSADYAGLRRLKDKKEPGINNKRVTTIRQAHGRQRTQRKRLIFTIGD